MTFDPMQKQWMPLTLPQLDFWEEFIFHPDFPVSTVAHYIDIEGRVDQPALLKAIRRTITEAEILSVRFRVDKKGGYPQQRIERRQTPMVKYIDLTAFADPDAEAHNRMNRDISRPLDLRRDKLCAQWLLRVSENRYFWYIRAHHIILDAYGMNLIELRCSELYNFFCNQRDIGPSFYPFANFITEEQTYLASRKCREDCRYWTDYTQQMPRLPALDKGVEDYGAPGHHFHAKLSKQTQANLQQTAAATGVAWPDILFIISGLYVFYYLPRDSDDATTLWQPCMNRWGSVGAHIPAMLVNIVPFHFSTRADETVRALLQRTASLLKSHRRHSRYRIEQIAKDYGLARGSRFFFSPLINVLHFSPPAFAGCKAERHTLAAGPGDGFNLTLHAGQQGDRLTVDIDADCTMTTKQQFTKHQETLPLFYEKALSTQALDKPVSTL